MSTIEKVAELLKEGKTPREIIEMGYPKSTVYTAKNRLEKEKQRKSLIEVAQQLLHTRKGSLEIILSDLIMQSIRINDQLLKILKVCEAIELLEDEEKLTVFSEEELEKLHRICVVASALYNCYISKDPDFLDIKEVRITLPIPHSDLEKYLEFLKIDPDALRMISWHTVVLENEDEYLQKIKDKKGFYAFIKERLFLNVTGFSYAALKTYFIKYALPIALRALRRITELVDPSTLGKVLGVFGGAESGSSVDKRK